MEIDQFLDEIYQLVPETNKATDLLFEKFDNLLHEGRFEVCNEILERVDQTRLSKSLIRSFLVISFAAKDKLESRESFLKEASQFLGENLLEGLR